MNKEHEIDIIQDYEWDDISGNGLYEFGRDNYLIMDSTTGIMACRRKLLMPILGPNSRIEIALRIKLGRDYFINFSGDDNRPALSCLLDKEGLVSFSISGALSENFMDSGFLATFHNGIPWADKKHRKSYTVMSDEIKLCFEQWNLRSRSVCFRINNQPYRCLAGVLGKVKCVKSVELKVPASDAHPSLWISSFGEYDSGRPFLSDYQQLHWKPQPEIESNCPYDNQITNTELRPKLYHWMRVTTGYGYAKAAIPALRKGWIEFDVMTDDMAKETVFLLEEKNGILKNGVVCCGFYHKRFCMFNEIPPARTEIIYSDDKEKPIPYRPYHFKIEWDCNAMWYYIYIDGQPRRFGGAIRHHMTHIPRKGIDLLTIHTGVYGVRTPVHNSYWGAFRVNGRTLP